MSEKFKLDVGNLEKMNEPHPKAVYSFYEDCGRMGDLSGVFLTEKRKVEELIGTEVYFGEVLGKHSEIYFVIEEPMIEMISDNPELIAIFEKYPQLESGYDPVNIWECGNKWSWDGDDE